MDWRSKNRDRNRMYVHEGIFEAMKGQERML